MEIVPNMVSLDESNVKAVSLLHCSNSSYPVRLVPLFTPLCGPARCNCFLALERSCEEAVYLAPAFHM
jgi:hypothetical protein